jgi:hypothetical protein
VSFHFLALFRERQLEEGLKIGGGSREAKEAYKGIRDSPKANESENAGALALNRAQAERKPS